MVRGEIEALRAVQVDARADAARLRAAVEALCAMANTNLHGSQLACDAATSASRDAFAAELLGRHAHDGTLRDGLSFMIASWNHGGLIAKAVESALDTLAELPVEYAGHVLVIDDGSTDESAQVLATYIDDPRVHVVSSKLNVGLTRARNVLLAACRTRHAFVLDADNTANPDGVRAIYETAREYGSAITYGQVIGSTPEGSSWAAYAYAPGADSLRLCRCFDSMAVVDVDQIRAIGGYTTDIGLVGADDFELIWRCLRRGLLVGYVPTVAGRFRMSSVSMSAQVSDQRANELRISRMYIQDDPDFDELPIFAAHPAVGVVWRTHGAAARIGPLPESGPQVRNESTSGPRILAVLSGGVGNLGDDAIGDAVMNRIRRSHPEAAVTIVSDRNMPELAGGPLLFAGSVVDLWRGLTPDELSGAIALSGDEKMAMRLRPDVSRASLCQLSRFDLAVFAGGGNLASPFAAGCLIPRVAIALALGALNVPVIWSGQGIGPCLHPELELVAAAAKHAVAFGCRDPGSVEAFDATVNPALRLVGDDALGQPVANDEEIDELLAASGVATSRFVILHVRVADYAATSAPESFADIASAVDELAVEIGGTVVGLAVNSNVPHEGVTLAQLACIHRRRAPWRVVDVLGNPAAARGLLGRAEAVISHSYHVALWAIEAGTPAVLGARSAYYGAKAVGLTKLAGLQTSIALSEPVSTASLREHLGQIHMELGAGTIAEAARHVDAWWDDQLCASLGPARSWVNGTMPDVVDVTQAVPSVMSISALERSEAIDRTWASKPRWVTLLLTNPRPHAPR